MAVDPSYWVLTHQDPMYSFFVIHSIKNFHFLSILDLLDACIKPINRARALLGRHLGITLEEGRVESHSETSP